MGMRGGPTRRIVGNPLGGILRDVDRRTRSTTRRRSAGGAPAPQPGPEQPPAVRQRVAATVLETDDTGRALWVFPYPFARPPVLSALPSGDQPFLTVAEEVTETGAVVRVWAALGLPAGPGVSVHVRAAEADED
jgi:hypothetical protein